MMTGKIYPRSTRMKKMIPKRGIPTQWEWEWGGLSFYIYGKLYVLKFGLLTVSFNQEKTHISAAIQMGNQVLLHSKLFILHTFCKILLGKILNTNDVIYMNILYYFMYTAAV